MTPRLLSATSMTGTDIHNLAGETLGQIKDLMVDWRKGHISYAVLSSGGFIGIGETLYPVPLEAFEFDTAGLKGKVILDISKERLMNAPSFDYDNWPQHKDEAFMKSVYDFYQSSIPDTENQKTGQQ